jgi:hypothetical protein
MQDLHELAEIPLLSLRGQFEVQPPHARAEDCEPIIHILSGGHPVSRLVTYVFSAAGALSAFL